MLRRIYTLTALILFAIAIILALWLMADRTANRNNSFLRKTFPHALLGKRFIKLNPKDNYYLVGNDGSDIFIGIKNRPNQLIRIDDRYRVSSLKIVMHDSAKFSQILKFHFRRNTFQLADGYNRKIWLDRGDGTKFNESFSTPYFTDYIAISQHSTIYRSVQKGTNMFIKMQNFPSRLVSSSFKILERQVDGIFCTDGRIIPIANSNDFIYLYYHRNQFLVIDTNLNLKIKCKTIDTTSRANIKVTKGTSNASISLSSPPKIVNRMGAANRKFLFVNSGLKSDNETKRLHNNSAAIDMYSIVDGKYLHSFYIPDFDGQRLKDFLVSDQKLIALFDSYVYVFDLKVN